MKRKNEAYCVGHRSLLHWASKPVAMGIEAGCIFGTVKHPASTHLTEEPNLLEVHKCRSIALRVEAYRSCGSRT